MEVPYHASGASFRAQYSLASQLSASSNANADAHSYIRTTLARLSSPGLTSIETRECLLLLMQAETALTHKAAAKETAFPHAVKLAEGGARISDRRIGYLFLELYMSPSHALALLLVNTIRKDLESANEVRITLALSTLMYLPSDDVIPAVRSRVAALLAHQSPNIQRAALGAICKLGTLDNSILEEVSRAKDTLLQSRDVSVLSAILDVIKQMLDSPGGLMLTHSVELLSSICDVMSKHCPSAHVLRLKAIQLHGKVLLRQDLPDVDRKHLTNYVLRTHLDYAETRAVYAQAILLEIYRCSHSFGPDLDPSGFIGPVRRVLSDYTAQPNEVYWTLACLEALPVQLWSDAFDEGEVKILVGSLNADDESTRRMALRVFKKADRTTLKLHFEALLEAGRTARAMEAASVMEDSGEAYARRVRQVVSRKEKSDKKKRKQGGAAMKGESEVMQDVVEGVLTHLRDRESLRASFTHSMLASVGKGGAGPTLVLITSAVACEYSELSGFTPETVVQTLTSCLAQSQPSIQEALLLAMLRVSAACESNQEVLEAVHLLKAVSTRHIQRRCDQFEQLSGDRTALRRLAGPPTSETLPGFLAAVESYFNRAAASSSSSRNSPAVLPSSPRLSGNKLRYAAYDSPRPVSRLQRSHSGSSAQSGVSRESEKQEMERTLTPGELALLGEESRWREADIEEPSEQRNPTTESLKSDLIALDSPVRTQHAFSASNLRNEAPSPPELPRPPTTTEEFDNIWRNMGESKELLSRGWCGETPMEVLDRLRKAEEGVQSFAEDSNVIRVYVYLGASFAVLLCRTSEDGSCLWILKSKDAQLRHRLRGVLQQDID